MAIGKYGAGRAVLVGGASAMLGACAATSDARPDAGALGATQNVPSPADAPPAPAMLDSGAPMVAPILTTPEAFDAWTFAEPEKARVSHVSLDLDLDFDEKQVAGVAVLDVIAAPGADKVVLDMDGYNVVAVTDQDGVRLPFTIGKRVDGKGQPLGITLPSAPASAAATPRKVKVRYIAPKSNALQWLAPEQTAGGRHPFLFSQGQAILNRSWIPTQDSPGIRQTWDASITVPEDLTVVMSGLSQGAPEEIEGGKRRFRFRMDKPVAPYLIAIAAGDIAFRELGPRTGVWAEPSELDRAAAELEDTEAMVSAAEALYGPYRWGRYDMIVLPPAFPYGGMENPVMTFLTPTFIAGDKSLTGLIAHELAHSWSGNLVTNANWADGWLNEGVTSYFENRITEEIYGKKRASQEAALSFSEMEEAIAANGSDSIVTALHTPLDKVNPDGSSSGIVYDKGATFLRTVENIVGRERFDIWLRSWFDRHPFQPATSDMFVADMREHLVKGDKELEAKLMLDEWVYAPGLPANVLRPDPAAFAEVDKAAAQYGTDGVVSRAAWDKWSTAERLRYMAELPREQSAAQLSELDGTLGLSETGNNEVLFAWLELALANRYDPALPLAGEFLSRVGRAKFVVPLYRELMATGDWGEPFARQLYQETRPRYHAVTQRRVDKIMAESDS